MKKPTYLSPSAIALYEQSPTDYYLRYLSMVEIPREPQNRPMSIGSSFDAYVKSYLYENLFGKNDPRFEFDTIFAAQVESQNRDWALKNGLYVFEQYKQSGCLGDLMLELKGAKSDPRFEFEVRGAVHGYREGVEGRFGEVVLLGKPDVDFVNKNGVHCILDFKVNGYCANYARSPMSHYIRMRSAGRTDHGQHIKCRAMDIGGIICNVNGFLEHLEASWARQLSIYAWLCGEPIGAGFVTIIHQLVCNPLAGILPGIRVAEHVNRVGREFQQRKFDEAITLWEIVQSDWFFREMTEEQSKSRCRLLDLSYSRDLEKDSVGVWVDSVSRS